MGKKVIIIPDSFKGSISSAAAAGILGEAARKAGFETVEVPVADGGEGTVDCVLKITGGRKEAVRVTGPEGTDITAKYVITPNDEAVIEIAESTGITRQNGLHPMTAETFGFGQLILDALDSGVRKFFLGLGGSASTDCGLGMAAALGVRFLNGRGECFIPCGLTLRDIAAVETDGLDPRVGESSFCVLSDVTIPLFGPNGAAYVFSPQKGANPEQVRVLDDGLRGAARLIEQATGCDPDSISGAGAAGGAGYGCAAFLGARIKSGIEVILELCGFDRMVGECGLIVTGEGSLDSQSLMGKVLSGIKAHSRGKPIVSFCGKCELGEDVLRTEGITAVEIGRDISLDESIRNGEKYLRQAAEEFFMGASVVFARRSEY